MRRVIFAALVFACASGSANAKNLDADIMPQPDAPIRVVGCSADLHELRNGQNFSVKSSFEDVGPRTATAVRIGFAFFDVLGERRIFNGLSTGTYTPGARIDVTPFGGQVGAETRKLVCFAVQAAFADGTSWKATTFPSNGPATPALPAGAPLPAEIVKQETAPVRFDGCTIGAPNEGLMQTALTLTNTAAKPVRRVDVDFGFFDASGNRSAYFEWMTGNYAPGSIIRAGTKLRAGDATFTKVSCALRRVEFADGTSWNAPVEAQS